MELQIDNDYGPITVTNIVDRSGNPAQIDGPAKFVLLGGVTQPDGTLTPGSVGELVVASGDTRTLPDGSQAFPDGCTFLKTGTVVGQADTLQCHVDPNLNPDITDDKVIASESLVTIGGVAAVGTVSLGQAVPKV